MARPSNRQLRRKQIASAMLSVMSEKGYDRAAISEVARRAGLNQGLLHYHFKSKQEILLAALGELMRRQTARLDVVLAAHGSDPVAQVRAFLNFHLGLGAAANPQILAAWLAIGGEALRQAEVGAAYQDALGEIAFRLRAVIEFGQADGKFVEGDASAMAGALIALIQGYFQLAAGARTLVPRGSAARSAIHMAAGLLDAQELKSPVRHRSQSTAIYAGTFDPLTSGHLSVIRASAGLFQKVIVLVAVNPDKTPLFSVAERLTLIDQSTSEMPNVSSSYTKEYVVHYAREKGATHLVRGLRDASDAEYETRMAQLNRELAPEVLTLFVPADPDLSQVSSSRLKEMARAGEDISHICPPLVAQELRAKLAQGKGEAS